MQPFNFNHIKIVLIALLTFGLQLLFPPLEHFVLDIVVRSGLITLVYILLCYKLNTSDELIQIINKYRNRL
jgi:hypothetical protein